MNLREGLRQALLANAGLVAIVGQQVWANFAPKGSTGTWVTIRKISGVEVGAHDGQGNLQRARYQLTLGGDDKAQIDLAQNILVQQFHCVEFTYTEATVPHVLTFFHADHRDDWDEPTRTYNTSVDLYIWTDH